MYSLIDVWMVHCHCVSKWAVPITWSAFDPAFAPSCGMACPKTAVSPIRVIRILLEKFVMLKMMFG
jgi:hypothetical protein